MTLAEAIAQVENVNPTYNNPCALTVAPNSYCQTGNTGILVNFCTEQDGWDACNNQIQLNTNRGMNLDSFFASYAPASAGNNPTAYASTVSQLTGIDQSTVLSSLDPSSLYYDVGSRISDIGISDIVNGTQNGIDSVLSNIGLPTTESMGIDPTMLIIGLVVVGTIMVIGMVM